MFNRRNDNFEKESLKFEFEVVVSLEVEWDEKEKSRKIVLD